MNGSTACPVMSAVLICMVSRMNAQDRKRLEELDFPSDDIAKTEEVLRIWGVDELFVLCFYCGKHCISPKVRNSKFRRCKPPSDLFRIAELGFNDRDGRVICWPCDEERFQ
ncbi:MAG: hypothetical protein AAFV88_21175 [Planctomycetota bacterium]